jgi:hypothetical protein
MRRDAAPFCFYTADGLQVLKRFEGGPINIQVVGKNRGCNHNSLNQWWGEDISMIRTTLIKLLLMWTTTTEIMTAAARLPLSDKALPFLSIDSAGAGLLRWDSAAVLDAVRGAAMVEVSPRGLRFIAETVSLLNSKQNTIIF